VQKVTDRPISRNQTLTRHSQSFEPADADVHRRWGLGRRFSGGISPGGRGRQVKLLKPSQPRGKPFAAIRWHGRVQCRKWSPSPAVFSDLTRCAHWCLEAFPWWRKLPGRITVLDRGAGSCWTLFLAAKPWRGWCRYRGHRRGAIEPSGEALARGGHRAVAAPCVRPVPVIADGPASRLTLHWASERLKPRYARPFGGGWRELLRIPTDARFEFGLGAMLLLGPFPRQRLQHRGSGHVPGNAMLPMADEVALRLVAQPRLRGLPPGAARSWPCGFWDGHHPTARYLVCLVVGDAASLLLIPSCRGAQGLPASVAPEPFASLDAGSSRATGQALGGTPARCGGNGASRMGPRDDDAQIFYRVPEAGLPHTWGSSPHRSPSHSLNPSPARWATADIGPSA